MANARATVALREDGSHGYRLKQELESLCDDFWEVNYGRLYRVLDVLDSAGDLDSMEQIQSGRPNRKVYRITDKGRQTLDDWLLLPVSDEPKPLRDCRAFLLVSDEVDPLAIADPIHRQTAVEAVTHAILPAAMDESLASWSRPHQSRVASTPALAAGPSGFCSP